MTLAIAMTSLLVIVGCRTESQAGTPQFPDMSGYAPVNVKDYEVDTTTPGIPSSGLFFLTPDGIICGIGGYPPGASCTGNNFPAVPPVTNGVNSIGTDTGLRTTNASIGQGNTVHGNPVKTLPPMHTITVDGTVCGVDDAGTTACKDPEGRGFVLSPKGSGWLPKA
ncbi:hypothetical protein A5662_07400 [Mycobacteriaceae bacterium 1482268.1]|nr:hypothetical protein A5662_07400 [Mycobacteriaceae bacterium 1482268.1]